MPRRPGDEVEVIPRGRGSIDQIAAQLRGMEQRFDRRLDQLSSAVDEVREVADRATETAGRAMGQARNIMRDLSGDPDIEDRNERWRCSGCSTVLGTYTPGEPVMRLNLRDQHIHVASGIGGRISCWCRRCSQENTLTTQPNQGVRETIDLLIRAFEVHGQRAAEGRGDSNDRDFLRSVASALGADPTSLGI